MFLEESFWIRERLLEMDLSKIRNVIDIGSSSLEFRQVVQPYIDKNIFSLLRDRSINVMHLDKKCEAGVDIICDFSDVEQLAQVDEKFDIVICTNVLEHVENLGFFVQAVTKFIGKGGYLIVTVPRKYRIHPDPIDTGFRPTNIELENLFPGLKPVRSEIIRIDSKMYYHDTIPDLVRYLMLPFRWSISCMVAQA